MLNNIEIKAAIVFGVLIAVSMAKKTNVRSIALAIAAGVPCGLWGAPWMETLLFQGEEPNRSLFFVVIASASGTAIINRMSAFVESSFAAITSKGGGDK